MTDIEISTAPERMQLEVILGFLRQTYWASRIRREVFENALKHSLVVGAFVRTSGGAQVGFARIVTDTATFAWLCDVFVAESHRGRGIAKRMIHAAFAHPQISTLRRWCLATRDAQPLYRHLGFTPVAEGRWMELRMPESDWQEVG